MPEIILMNLHLKFDLKESYEVMMADLIDKCSKIKSIEYNETTLRIFVTGKSAVHQVKRFVLLHPHFEDIRELSLLYITERGYSIL
jgi:hypothetical protein